MAVATAGAIPGLVLSATVGLAAAVMAYRQWADRGRRDPGREGGDAPYFARQDRRRFLGTALMGLLAVGIAVGTNLGPIADRAQARFFARTWVAVGVLCVALLVLAMRDWQATHAFARRHRRALAAERRAIVEDELRRRAVPRNGHAGPRRPPGV